MDFYVGTKVSKRVETHWIRCWEWYKDRNREGPQPICVTGSRRLPGQWSKTFWVCKVVQEIIQECWFPEKTSKNKCDKQVPVWSSSTNMPIVFSFSQRKTQTQPFKKDIGIHLDIYFVILIYNVRTKEVNLSVGVRVKIWACVKPLQAFSAAGKRLTRWCYGRLKWQQQPSPRAFYHAIKSQIRHPVATPVHTQTQIGLHSALLPAASLIMSPCHCQSMPLVSLW